MNSPQTVTQAPAASLQTTTPPAEVIAATRLADAALENASGMVIDSAAGYQAAADDLKECRARWKAIEAQRVHLKEPFLEGCRRIDTFFAVPLSRLEEAGDAIKSRMLEFDTAEQARVRKEREAREATERAEREALEQQQREAARREREAREEADRVAREAQARADQERLEREREAHHAREKGDEAAAHQAEAAAQAAQEQADREAEAARAAADTAALDAQQHAEAAQNALELAEVAPIAAAPISKAKASGAATRRTWKVKSVDKLQLVLGIAEAHKAGDQDKVDQLLAYVLTDDAALNRIAAALKAHARVPGVLFGEVANIATTGRGR